MVSQRSIIDNFKQKPKTTHKPKEKRDSASYINRFTERHLIESLAVGPVREERSVMFFNMLNCELYLNNKNLQNLLILTAIKAEPERVMDFIHRLDNFDGPEIAKIASSDEYCQYEEALAVYKKFAAKPGESESDVRNHIVKAVDVLIEKIKDGTVETE